MKSLRILAPLSLLLTPLLFLKAEQKEVEEPLPLKALLIAGGCCHDYEAQHKLLSEGIQARANVRVDVVWTADRSTNPPLPIFDDPNWADGYDIIIHDECAASNKDLKAMENILAVHQSIPAVHLHCAMHSFRNGTDKWPKHLGIHSTSHGPQKPLSIQYTDPNHPITKGLEDWVTKDEELYNNHEVFDITPIALATQKIDDRVDSAVVAWTNEKAGAPSFSTTIGHNNYTVEDPRYLDLVTRGLLWSVGHLNDTYLTPYTGSNVITEMKAEEESSESIFANPPADATFVTLTASSTQTSDGHYPWKAIDGSEKTRWTANGPSMPAWLQLEFQKPTTITASEILWERRDQWYHYKIETSLDGQSWTIAYDGSANTRQSDTTDTFRAEKTKFLRVTVLKQQNGSWPAFWELRLTGEKDPLKLFPILNEAEAAQTKTANGKGLEQAGNIKPFIPELTPEIENEILKDASVPEGFDMTLFASWQSANYPVYLAASPGGDLYVSSDGNGSLGRQPNRGRVLRLRDTDSDGRADQVTEFIRDIDSPRGLIWDQDRLYLLHPPHISVFFDRDHDGVAESSQRLISDIAFGFKDRPADHTTNGLEMGIDGWIYIAGGDFGFMKATGTDGRTLSHRGGGVIRFRPDGSGLELYSTGTRNILATPMSPTLDMFTRDNTNDGGGWDVRFHHLTPLADHGYPRLYKNFDKETITPLADYGGGSGCGGVYLSEPGFPAEWNNAPFTVDWGQAGSYRHSVEPHGATFKETAAPKRFIKMTRPTDATVDGMSAVYQAAWKGPATFGWAGPDQGYIVRVTPKNYTPDPLPEFAKMTNGELIATLESPSHIRRLAAQRAILRRDLQNKEVRSLIDLYADPSKAQNARIAALYAVIQMYPDTIASTLTRRNDDPATLAFLLRSLGDLPPATVKPFAGLFSQFITTGTSREKLESAVSAARLNFTEVAPAIAGLLSDKDPVIRHTAYRALAKMSAHEAAFSQVDSDDIDTRKAAAWALMRMHKPEVVNELISRLATQQDLAKRRPLISILARLYHTEAEWKGNSWGTRPDTRGPYYELTTWEQSGRILTALKSLLEKAPPEEAGFIVEKLNKNRIQDNSALQRIVELATRDDQLIPAAISQIAAASNVPPNALPIVIKGARTFESGPAVHADAVGILMKSDHPDTILAVIDALNFIDRVKGSDKQATAARGHFFNAPKLENHHLVLEKIAAEKPDSLEGRWSAMAVLQLASRKKGSPESREMSLKAIDTAWQHPAQKINYINAARDLRNPVINDRIKAATTDPDSTVATAAQDAARKLNIPLPKTDNVVIARIKAVPALLRFDQTRIDIKLGQKIQLTLSNPDKMAHNLVVTQPGSDKAVAKAALALGAQGFEKGWLPDHPDIIAATKMLNENEEDTIEIEIKSRGKYPFICSFPGHENTMLGVIVVK